MDPLTILVVDDEAAQRELLGGFLAKRGWSVELAASGTEALTILHRTAVDLVLADYKMPDLSGIDLLKATKQLNPEIAVILITAYGSIASAVEAMKAGAYDYLTKPIELDELVYLIERIAERQWLLAEVRERRFREDLYYRLNVFPIVLPPLRERREDIPLLIEFLLKKFAARLGKSVIAVSREAMDVLMKYDYPGNVRALENILERASILARHEALYVEDLPLHLRQGPPEGAVGVDTRHVALPEVLRAIERQMLLRALERHGGVQTRAASELGISERVLRYKLQKHHLQVEGTEAQNGGETAPPASP